MIFGETSLVRGDEPRKVLGIFKERSPEVLEYVGRPGKYSAISYQQDFPKFNVNIRPRHET